MDGRPMPEHGHTISSPCEPNGSGEPLVRVFSGVLVAFLYFDVCPQAKCHLKGVSLVGG